MTLHSAPMDPNLSQIIKLAVLAVGGQGGGVLTGWIEEVARAEVQFLEDFAERLLRGNLVANG